MAGQQKINLESMGTVPDYCTQLREQNLGRGKDELPHISKKCFLFFPFIPVAFAQFPPSIFYFITCLLNLLERTSPTEY